MKKSLFVLFISIFLALPDYALSARFLWDATRESSRGNADWVIDADDTYGSQSDSDAQRYPSPNQSNITSSTSETYWFGGNSEWAIRLVKAGHYVETLPRNASVTFGSSSNTQDLSNYDVYILNEPQSPFTASERESIYSFIESGGGVMMVGDHCVSDRNQNGWDSPMVFNDLQVQSRLGVWFKNDRSCEFTQNVINVRDDENDEVIHGPFGDVGLIECHGAINITLYPEVNSSVLGRAWRNPYPQAYENCIVATCLYGDGRVGFVNDSSLTDDGTGDPNDTLHDNFSVAENDDDHLMLNLSVWLAEDGPPQPTATPEPNPTPPTPTPTPSENIFTGVDLDLNGNSFWAGDQFILIAICGNAGTAKSANLWVILDVYGQYFFYPDWSLEAASKSLFLQETSKTEYEIFNFEWPYVLGNAQGFKFWGAMTDTSGSLLGLYDMVEWGYE